MSEKSKFSSFDVVFGFKEGKMLTLKTMLEQKCPKSQIFLNSMCFLVFRKKKRFKKKRLMPIYPKFSFGACYGKHEPFFLA